MIIIWFPLLLPISLIFLRRLSINFRNAYGKIFITSIRVQYCALRVTVFLQIYLCILIDFAQYCFAERKLLICGEQNFVIMLFIGLVNYWIMERKILFTGEKHFAGSLIFCLREKLSNRQYLGNPTNPLSTFVSSLTCLFNGDPANSVLSRKWFYCFGW